WSLPRAHYLETWGDGRDWDGTISLTQPLILPLYGGKSPAELLAFLADGKWTDGYDLIRGALASVLPKDQFEKAWRRSLHDGIVKGSAPAPVSVTMLRGKPLELASSATVAATAAASATATDFELVFTQSELHDGRFANNGWLQEAPDPMTKLTWDNVALISK